MLIDKSNYEIGRNAMMHAVYFYYQLLEEGEFSCGQTAYWLYDELTIWEILEVVVEKPIGISWDIDPEFIHEAALVYILCILENQYQELEPNEFPTEDSVEYQALKNKGMEAIPEISDILLAVSRADRLLFNNTMRLIFEKYVKGRFAKLTR